MFPSLSMLPSFISTIIVTPFYQILILALAGSLISSRLSLYDEPSRQDLTHDADG